MAQQVRRHLGAAAEPLAQSLEALDRLRYGQGGRPVPGSVWQQQFKRHIAILRR